MFRPRHFTPDAGCQPFILSHVLLTGRTRQASTQDVIMKELRKPKPPLASPGQVMQYCSACTRTVNIEISPDSTCTSPPWCRRGAAQIARQQASPKKPTRPIKAANSDKVFRKVAADGPYPRRYAARTLKTRLVATTRQIEHAQDDKDDAGAPLKPYGGNDLGDGLA